MKARLISTTEHALSPKSKQVGNSEQHRSPLAGFRTMYIYLYIPSLAHLGNPETRAILPPFLSVANSQPHALSARYTGRERERERERRWLITR